MSSVLYLYIFLLLQITIVKCSEQCSCESNIVSRASPITKKVLPPGYDPTVLPPQEEGKAVVVRLAISIGAIPAVHEDLMDMEATFILKIEWRDHRLNVDGNSTVRIPREDLGYFWCPDLYFKNAKSWSLDERFPIKGYFLLKPSNRISVTDRYFVTTLCDFDLRNYPFDVQRCVLEVESFGHQVSSLALEFAAEGVNFDKSLAQLPQFQITNITAKNCSVSFAMDTFEGVWDCLGFTVTLERRYVYYLWQVYFPSVILVLIAGLSFWIDTSAVPGRVTLGITTLLTLATQFTSIQKSLPPVSYLKAIDVWMFACVVFVFFSLVEFVVALAWETGSLDNIFGCGCRRRTKIKQFPQNSRTIPTLVMGRRLTAGQLQGLRIFDHEWSENKIKKKENMVDKRSRVLYLGAFIIFNIVYWVVYL